MKVKVNPPSHFLERARESGENPTQPNICRTNWLRESRNQRVTSVDNADIWAGDPQCPGNRDTNFTTWPDDQSFPEREDSPTIMVVERIGQFGVDPQRSNFREHSVCTNSVSNFRCSSVDEHIPVPPVVTDTVHPTRSADSQEFCRSVMENSEPVASRSDLGLGIIDTACLFCVAGSDWWANYKSLLEDFGLKHEIDETREAEIQIW